MRNVYKTAFEKGVRDAKKGKQRNYRGMTNGIMSFNFDEHVIKNMEAYDAGYEAVLAAAPECQRLIKKH